MNHNILFSSKYVKKMFSVSISYQNRGADGHINDAQLFRQYMYIFFQEARRCPRFLLPTSILFILQWNNEKQEDWILHTEFNLLAPLSCKLKHILIMQYILVNFVQIITS